MASLADKAILSGVDNRPLMLEKDMYDSWKSRMELYMLNRPHGIMILESVEQGPLIWPSVEVEGVTRLKKYSELSAVEAIQADCDVKATNIILQGLPPEKPFKLTMTLRLQTSFSKDFPQRSINCIFVHSNLSSVCKITSSSIGIKSHGVDCLEVGFVCISFENGPLLWPIVEENGVTRTKKHSELSATEAIQADCDVKATNIILQGLPPEVYELLKQFQVNTKFLNTLPPEWSKFVTDVKLVRDLHTTNVDQLHGYLGQHEYHANEVRLNILVFSVWNTISFFSVCITSSIINTSFITYPVNDFQSSVHHNVYNPSSSIPQVEYAPVVHQQSEFSQPDTGLVVPVFQKGDDPIDAINHMMLFLTAVVTSRYPPTNNQLKTSSNPRQQATINNGRVTIQPIHGRQNSVTAGMSRQYTSGPSGTSRKQRVIVCYNCKGEGHMSKKCTKPKRKRDEAWFKDKNSSSPAQQDVLFLFVIEQLKTQVVNCTKINQDNKNVNEFLIAELERYKDQESLEQKVTLLKNDFQKEESQNIDRELALEKQDFKTRFVPQTKLLAEQAFWSRYSVNSKEPNLSSSTTIVEFPKELPKVSMVNSSLKKLKFHLASFDVVVKERTTATAITKGTWGFEHTKACFRDEIIPFVKALRDLFNSFDQFLIDELTEVQNVFNQME
nr:hypothetical protein [Tanacetum cinerariifolium]